MLVLHERFFGISNNYKCQHIIIEDHNLEKEDRYALILFDKGKKVYTTFFIWKIVYSSSMSIGINEVALSIASAYLLVLRIL